MISILYLGTHILDVDRFYLDLKVVSLEIQVFTSTLENFPHLIQQQRFSLVIVDEGLALRQNGQALALVHQHQPQTPIIVVTEAWTEQAAFQLWKLGVTNYLLSSALTLSHPTLQQLIRQAEQHYQQVSMLMRRYRNIFESAPIMYVILKKIGGQPIIIDCNRLFLHTLHYRRDQVIGKPLHYFYHPQQNSLSHNDYDHALSRIIFDEERQLRTADDQLIETVLRATTEYDLNSQAQAVLAMYIDITQRKKIEIEIYQRNRDLTMIQYAGATIASTHRFSMPSPMSWSTCSVWNGA